LEITMSEPHETSAERAHVDPLIHVAQPDVPDREADARAWAGKAVRDLGHALVGHQAPLELIDEVSTTLDELTGRLAAGGPRSRADRQTPGAWSEPPADHAEITSHDERPISGRASPWGLDLRVWREGDDIVAMCTLRSAHEGAPGRSHGGIVAALFDDVYGFLLTAIAQPAFTGELSLRYEAGVPLGVPLECRVRIAEQSGRKLFMEGELSANGTVVTRSKATFITIPRERFEQLASTRD
jgi:acyl-coenzyme A thioesterase PaaI-like protein